MRNYIMHKMRKMKPTFKLPSLKLSYLSLLSDSNQRPRDYKSRALAN